MLPKELRFSLRSQSDFFDTSQRIQSAHLVLFFRPSTESSPRWAVIVKKTHGKAHERLKTKRLLREAIRELSPSLFGQNEPRYDLVVLAKGKPQEYQVYVQELQTLAQQLA